jgi:integrase
MATFLQTLKETFADPGEALKLRCIDISEDIITINHPLKGHLPGQIELSQKLVSMLNNLPKTSEYIFPIKYRNLMTAF